jgi:hypothetical protein
VFHGGDANDASLAGGTAFIPGWPTVCALVSCKGWVTLLRLGPIYSPLTIHYSLARAAANQTETPRQSRGVSDVFDDLLPTVSSGEDAYALPHEDARSAPTPSHARSAVSTDGLPQGARLPSDALPVHTHART